MQGASSSVRNLATILAASLLAFILGYIYVQAFSVGWRAIVALHLGVFFFLGCALFISDLRSFLLFIMIFAVPLEYGYHLTYQLLGAETSPFSIGLRIDVVDVVLVLLYLHWAFSLAQEPLGRVRITVGSSIGKLFFAWVAWVTVAGILRSEHWNYTFFELVALFKGLLLYFYLVNNLRSERDLRVIIYAFFAVTVAQGLYILMQYVTGYNYTLHGETSLDLAEPGQVFRAIGFTGWDGGAAIMNYVLPIMLIYYLAIADRFKRWAMVMGIGLVLVGLLLTKLRTAYLAALVSTITVVGVSYLRGWISPRRILMVMVAGLACLVAATPFVLQRFETGGTGLERIPLMLTALNMIKDNFLLGVGANNYFFYMDQYLPVSQRHTWQYTVHNEYLLRAAETGIPGFLLYYSLLLVMMKKLWIAGRSSNPWIYAASLGLFAGLLGSIPYRLTSFFHTAPLLSEFCVVLALTYLLENLEKRRLSQEGSDPRLSRGNRLGQAKGMVASLSATILLLAVFPAQSAATTYHVSAATGNDMAAGTETEPFKTITRASKALEPGDTVLIHEGVYHEQIMGGKSGLQGAPITYQGIDRSKVILQGSVLVKDWSRDQNLWVRRGLAPITAINAFVMVDQKRMLREVRSKADMPEGSFHLATDGTYSIRLWHDADPNRDHQVEVYELDLAFNSGDRWGGTAKKWITLRNMTLEKYGSFGVSTDFSRPADNAHWELDNIIVRYNRAEGVFQCLDDWYVHDCVFMRNGRHGCQINGARVMFVNNLAAENEWFGESGIGGCGILIGPDESAHSTVIRNNIFRDNGDYPDGYGCGIYLEGRSRDNLIENNLIEGGTSSGIGFFGSSHNKVINNLLVNVAPKGNWDKSGAFVVYRSFEGAPTQSVGNLVAHNTVWRCSAPLVVMDPENKIQRDDLNRFVNNLFAQCRYLSPPPKSLAITLEGNGFFYCPPSKTATEMAWWLKGMVGKDEGGLSDNVLGKAPGLNDPAAGDFHLKPESPARGAGVRLDHAPTDRAGNPRPSDKRPDIGAYQY
ncbi:MAG: right-handed parallel beta-helix repeat-containing protein [Desulfomonile tiedjei]|nr:right-handed parallel beta-helix repeat-containing protein [Desulfomonile tiedjei]